MIFNVHAGHNPDGKIACGAIGLIKESTQARIVKEEVIKLLKKEGHRVYDCTCDNGINQSDVLSKIVKKCNANKVDLDISIHFNSGRNDKDGDGSTGGVEVLIYDKNSKTMNIAIRICKKISSIGFRNRGVHIRNDLYYLRKTKNPALLIECCFVDDADDVKKYNYKKMASAIVDGILDIDNEVSKNDTKTPEKNKNFKVRVIAKELNIRSGAGVNNKIVGCIKDKGIYTITKTSGNWGYLKSKTGWINISSKYVKRV